MNFLNFFEFIYDLILLKKGQKGVIYPQELQADMARRWTHTDATWHARPCGSATWTHASACVALMWHEHVAGPREPMRTPGWCLRGTRNSPRDGT